ncbi:LysR family transcriptional regulator [uncultured Ruegeria sp.]|uniref:LysR family transcriptional regulator n=1 Tax=uncultured Ruegeria sp. TaxID=259304 RepID=UPI0026271ACA|nr:LysR family transcriptional regulator [uncultured Ruegeria sp.]
MEMNQIRYFLAVCEHGNFTHASQAMNVSQPSLTTAIKKLENELGGPLLLRDRAGCRLTPLGAIVHPRLQEALQQTHQAQVEAARHVRLKRVPIGIGVGETIGQSKISEAIERYRNRNPKADIELIVDSHTALLEGLREGRFDIAVTVAQASEEIFQIDTLYEERYCAVVSTEHPLSQHETVALNMLAGNDMLDRLNCEMREFMRTTSAERGCKLYAAYRSNRVDWLLELARNGTGFLVLPETAIPNEEGLVKLSIEDVQIHRQVAALRCRFQPSRPEAHDLVRELMKVS